MSKKEVNLQEVMASLDEAETKCIGKYVSNYVEDNEFEHMGSAWLNAFNGLLAGNQQANTQSTTTTETSKTKEKTDAEEDVERLTPDAVLDADGNVIA